MISSRPLTPYCVSRLIQFLSVCYRFYIYCKCPKINTFQKSRCTHAWAAIIFLIGFATLSIFHSVKNNDNPFFSGAIVIFCTQRIIASFHSFNHPVVTSSRTSYTLKTSLSILGNSPISAQRKINWLSNVAVSSTNKNTLSFILFP